MSSRPLGPSESASATDSGTADVPVALGPEVRKLGVASNPKGPMTSNDPRFRATLIRVLIVQAVALTLLGLLQAIYNV